MKAKRENLTERESAKRDQIRSGARRVFMARGFGRSSTDDIAAEAGVSKQTLYVYYSNKEDLLADVLQNIVLESPQAPFADLGELDPKSITELRESLLDRMHKVVEVVMNPEYLALLRVIISEAPRMPNMGEIYLSTVPERGIRFLSEVLGRTNARGITNVPDTEVAARMLVGVVMSYAITDGLLAPEGGIISPSTQQMETAMELFVKATEAKL